MISLVRQIAVAMPFLLSSEDTYGSGSLVIDRARFGKLGVDAIKFSKLSIADVNVQSGGLTVGRIVVDDGRQA